MAEEVMTGIMDCAEDIGGIGCLKLGFCTRDAEGTAMGIVEGRAQPVEWLDAGAGGSK